MLSWQETTLCKRIAGRDFHGCYGSLRAMQISRILMCSKSLMLEEWWCRTPLQMSHH